MKLNIKKIIRPLDLEQYAQELHGQAVHVWVNPSRSFLQERDEITTPYSKWLEDLRDRPEETLEKFNKYLRNEFTPAINSWFAVLWSQHDNAETHWTAAEIEELENADPALLEWMKRHSMQMIAEHRSAEKKS